MTPRLEVAPLTDEDFAIVVDHRGDAYRAYFMGTRLAHSRGQDRIDAALMWSMMGAAIALGASTHERRNLLAFYFGDPFLGCRLFE